jgi:hypothetical protein
MNATKFVLVALVTLNSIACASSTIPHAFRTVGFTEEEVTIIQHAASQWPKPTLFVSANSCPDDVCSTIRLVDKIVDKTEALGITVKNNEKVVMELTGLTQFKRDYEGVRVTGDVGNTDDAELYNIQIINARSSDVKDVYGESLQKACASVTEYPAESWESMLYSVTIHEVGHTLGKHHINVGNVMQVGCRDVPSTSTLQDLADD